MQKRLKKVWNNEFIRGGAFFVISFSLANVINLIYTLIAGRLLGPAGYGEITALLSYINIISVPVSVVIIIITRKVSENDENGWSTAAGIEQFFWKTIKKWGLFILLSFLITPVIPYLTNLSFITAVFFLPLFWAIFLFSIYGSFLQGMRMFLMYSIITLVSPGIKLIGPVISQFAGNGILIVLLFLFFSFFLPFVWMYKSFATQAKKNTMPVETIERKIRNIIMHKQFLITTASILGMTLLNNFDVIFVKKYFSAYDAGIYSSWSLLAKIILYAIGPISSVSFVFFSSKKQSANHSKTLLFTVGLLIIVGIISFVFYTFFAKTIITSLFGAKYYAVLPYLGYASIFGTLYALINYINSFFLARKSAGALILPFMFAMYIVCVFVFGKSLEKIMLIDIYFSASIMVAYIFYALLFDIRQSYTPSSR